MSWKVWFHPRRTERLLNELQSENDRLKEEINTFNARYDELSTAFDNAIADLERTEKAAESLKEDYEREVSLKNQLSIENDALRVKLEKYSDNEQRIKEIEALLSKVEEMKSHYESRINRLRNRIVSIRNASESNLPEANELLEIEMGEDIQPDVMRKKPSAESPDSEWLEELPD